MQITQSLHRALQTGPNRVCTIFGDRTRTVAETADRVARFAGALQALGLHAGDRVGMHALNSDRYHEYLFAVPWAGGVVNPVNTRWSAAEVAYSLVDCQTNVLIVDDAFADSVELISRLAPNVSTVIFCGEGERPDGMLDYEELVASHEPVADARRGGTDLYGIYYTGGTTGSPKGVTQAKAAAAWEDGFFKHSVVPVPLPGGGEFTRDELVRSGVTMQTQAALAPAFAELGASGQDALALAVHPEAGEIRHLHTVGTSPAMADAAVLLLLGDRSAAERAGLRPRARLLAAAAASADPAIMLTAGQTAVERVIAKAGLRPADIDVFEFAEAFSAMCLRFRRDLDAGPDRMNPHGGTMAMGHAFGATGAILVGQCVEELEEREGRYGVAAVSGAGGLGVAALLERVVA